MIAKNGDPEAIYVDHGKQFKSDGDRLNNFNFFCAAHLLVRVKLEADPNYSLAQLNRDLEAQNEKEWSIRWIYTNYAYCKRNDACACSKIAFFSLHKFDAEFSVLFSS